MLGMAQAPTYTRSTDFAADERENAGGRSTVRTDRVSAELDALGASVNALQANQERLQRDDGNLRDGLVTPESLSATTAAMFGGSDFVPRGAWVTTQTYAVKDMVEQENTVYVALVAHTSGTLFADDYAAGKWMLFPGAQAASVTIFEPTPTLSSTTAQAAIEEVDAKAMRLGLPDFAFNYGAF